MNLRKLNNKSLRLLLVKPHPVLNIARKLQKGFLHLEPLELEIVAGGVPEDVETAILDLGFEKYPEKAYEKRILEWQPDIVGLSGYSVSASLVKKLAKLAKSLSPDVLTIVGGVHATIVPGDYKTDGIDLIVRGEGGTAIKEIIERFKSGESLFWGDRVLSPKDTEFDKKSNLPPPAFPPCEEVPKPRRDLVERSKYFCIWTTSDTGRLDTMFPQVATCRTSVGCAFSCSFCVIPHIMNGKYVQRSPEDVVGELAELKEEYIYFVDDEMFLNIKRVKRIAELLKERGIKKKYISWTRSDTITKNPEVFKLWKQVGLDTLYVGLESMDEKRLDEYKKKAGVGSNRRAIELLREIGINLHAAFIVHPSFDVEDFRELESEVKKLAPAEVTFTVLSPSPGTKFWDEHKNDFICDPYRFYDCMHSILPIKLPLKRFYAHFGRLTEIALRANPLRVNKIKVPFRDFVRAIVVGTKYIFALRFIYKDY